MAITSLTAPAAITVTDANVANTTNTTQSLTVGGTVSGRYYRVSIYANGPNVTSRYLIGSNGGNATTTSLAVSVGWNTNSVMTALNGASSLGRKAYAQEWTNYQAFVDNNAPLSVFNSTVGAVTVSARSYVGTTSLDPYDMDAAGTQTITWAEPNDNQVGWRTYYTLQVNGADILTRGPFTTETNTLTLTATELAAFRNFINAANGTATVSMRVMTAWQLASVTNIGESTTRSNDSWTYTIPAVNTSSTNDRYKNLNVYNGSAWVTPSEVFVYNGTAWESYGNSANGSGKDIMIYNGSTWNRATLNITGTTATYNTAFQALSKSTAATSNTGLSFTYSNYTVFAKRVAYGWEAWISELLSSTHTYGWAGTETSGDNTEDYIDIYWKTIGPKWVEKMRLKTIVTTYYNAAPHVLDVAFLYANGVWYPSGATTPPANNAVVSGNYIQYNISAASYSGQGVWGDYFTFNQQDPTGFVGMRMRAFNNTSYKAVTQSTRFAEIDLHLGDLTQVPQWG